MKRILFTLLLCVATVTAVAREKVPAADSRITYVGRTLISQE